MKKIISCPECKSQNVLTNRNERVCRKCGYRTTDKKQFDKKEIVDVAKS